VNHRLSISQGILDPSQYMFHHRRIRIDMFTVPKDFNEDPTLALPPNPTQGIVSVGPLVLFFRLVLIAHLCVVNAVLSQLGLS
jgi:hypothetical protein